MCELGHMGQSGHIIIANGPPQLVLHKLTTLRGR